MNKTTTGHIAAHADWLDVHFESARPEYQDGLRWVGVQPGWTVLDAGCGGGSFLPLLAELVGGSGSIDALDLAPENIARVEALVSADARLAVVRPKIGSVLRLPFADATFDCVWSANVMQYLSEAEAAQVLAESRRVLKPGGTLAVKDFDFRLVSLYPIDPDLLARWIAARRRGWAAGGVLGGFCGESLPARLRRAGLVDVRAKGWLVERRAPVPAATRQFVAELFTYWGGLDVGLLAPDSEFWKRIGDNPHSLIDDPDFCFREGFVIAVGGVPA